MDMLGSFRVRMFAVIIIVAITGFGLESGHSSRMIVEPTIRYILKDYGFNNKISLFMENIRPVSKDEKIPASGSSFLQIPCDFEAVERNYGWYYNHDKGKQEFLPGVYLKVEENTVINPILTGQVEKIDRNDEGRTILIKHDNDLYSLYGGLKEILVDNNAPVDNDTVLGKSGKLLYLEIRNSDGPINPYNLINAGT